MFFPEGQVRVFVYGEPVNMRLSYDGLFALAKNKLGVDPLSGSLLAFINRRANQIKVLYFDRTGLCIWGMRLEEGRFVRDWSAVRTREMNWTGLKLMLEGIEPKRVYKRYRRASLHAASMSENATQRSAP
jgi:transposase